MTGCGRGGDIDTHADQAWNGDPETAPDNEEPPLCDISRYSLLYPDTGPQRCDRELGHDGPHSFEHTYERAADAEHTNERGDE